MEPSRHLSVVPEPAAGASAGGLGARSDDELCCSRGPENHCRWCDDDLNALDQEWRRFGRLHYLSDVLAAGAGASLVGFAVPYLLHHPTHDLRLRPGVVARDQGALVTLDLSL